MSKTTTMRGDECGMSNDSTYPTLHKPIPMESRVVVPASYCGEPRRGTVVGVAACHVIFWYIVLLDEPHEAPFGAVRAISVPGCELDGEGGGDWRLRS